MVIANRRLTISQGDLMPRKQRCCPIDSDTAKSMVDTRAQDEELAGLAWAVAHPIRVRIVRLLIERESCICGEIVEEMPVAQSTVSQHLKILREAGLIQGEISGPKVCYCISASKLQQLKSLIAAL